MLSFHFEDTDVLTINQDFYRDWLTDVCKAEGFGLGEVSIVFCSDEYLLEMNRNYLNHDYFTDIITFDYTEDTVVSGDLFISVDRLRENADTHNVMFHVEQERVIVHGVLHLLGYKDKSDDQQLQMTEKENWALGLIVSRGT